MKRTNASKLTMSAAIALGLFAAAGSAHAVTLGFPGSICNPVPNQTALAGYTPAAGIHDISSGDALPVVCGGSLINNVTTVNTVVLTVYDRSQNDNFRDCYVQLFDSNGTFLRQQNFPVQNVNQAAFFTLTANVVPAVNAASFAVACSIPAQTTGGFSHLANIKIN
jgi:hypothetical protein